MFLWKAKRVFERNEQKLKRKNQKCRKYIKNLRKKELSFRPCSHETFESKFVSTNCFFKPSKKSMFEMCQIIWQTSVLFDWFRFLLLLTSFFVSFTSVRKVHLKALFTQDILTHNIAIKRYCDKKIFLRQLTLASHRNPWLKNIIFFVISFYCNIVCQNILCE